MSPRRFRIWDETANRFYEPVYQAYKGEVKELLLSPKGDLIMRTMRGVVHESLFEDKFIVQWSTGLTDKNGKEIFEGDIVKHVHGQVSEVSWNYGAFDCGYSYNLSDQVGGFRSEICEVIGDVHQNPELLPKAA